MNRILEIKERLKDIYSNYSSYIDPLVRFIAIFSSILVIKHYIGIEGMLGSIVIVILVSALCCLLPINVGVFVSSLYAVAGLYYITPLMAVIGIMIYIIVLILYFRFSAKYGYVFMLMPVLFFFKIPYIMPLIVGVALAPSAMVAMAFGVVIYYMISYAGGKGITVINGTSISSTDKLNSFINNIISNKEMMLIIVAFVVAAIITYLIRKSSFDHSRTTAIICGAIIEIAIVIPGITVLDVDVTGSIWMIAIYVLISVLAVYVLDLFILAVDYQRTEYVQFEDDDYFYYVKAIPKIKVGASDVKVKHINVKNTRRRRK